MKIKKGDKVEVITGKDKGKKAVVFKAMPKLDMVLVEGINMKKKHKRAMKQGQKGQIIEIAAPIHVSNVKKA
jgi:large subunit ribosomal protein L24